MHRCTGTKSGCLLSVIAMGLMGAPAAHAAHNMLTAQEIAEGWILLYDGESLFGWANHGAGKWQSKDGLLMAEEGRMGWLGTKSDFSDFVLKLQYRISGDGNSGIFFRADPKSLEPWNDGYEMQINDSDANWPTGSLYDVTKAQHPDGKVVTGIDSWQDVEITVEGWHVTITLNGVEVLHEHNASKFMRGAIGVQYHDPGGMKVAFRNIKLKPLGFKSIFNGRNLDGWKVIPDHKSVYSVLPDGTLNVKNGNGQIETVGQWDDFVFQLDIISNGTHLNSGVFFRGVAGQFWNGYESQIRNEWISDVELADGTKVTGRYVDEGDQVTIKVGRRGQKKTFPKSQVKRIVHHRDQPYDFGTGGIYNRQPSRKVIPSDGEWFTKTIVASGRQISVWVNGYQTADFTDRRPLGPNARRQCRLDAGVISLQGHDRTTDLSFRNLKVAALPKGK